MNKKKITISNRTNPLKIEKIKGFGTLCIYQLKASKYWWARMYLKGKIIRQTTKIWVDDDKKKAIEKAKQIYFEKQDFVINNEPITKSTGFALIASKLEKENEARFKRKQIAETKITQDKYRLKNDLLPFFKKYQISDIDYSVIEEYFSTINNKSSRKDNPLHTNTLKLHLSHIQQILKLAIKLGVIKSLPVFPSFKTKDEPRSSFSTAEYAKLHRTLAGRIGQIQKIKDKNDKLIRNVELTQELYDLMIFMTNTFIRPTDIKVLKHSHIDIVRTKNLYLRLNHPTTKSHSNPVVSLEKAVEIYENIVSRQKISKEYSKDGYVFVPKFDNRNTALRHLQRQFNYLLEITKLKIDGLGNVRTLYSLRHSALMFRLLESQDLDLLTLARNARTSPEMLDRFYLKHYQPEMGIEKIQSQKNPKLQKKKYNNETPL